MNMIADVNSQLPFVSSSSSPIGDQYVDATSGVGSNGSGGGGGDLSTAQLAALKAAQARDGALIGLSDVNSLVHINSRHLLATATDGDDALADSSSSPEEVVSAAAAVATRSRHMAKPSDAATHNNNNSTTFNLTRKSAGAHGENASGVFHGSHNNMHHHHHHHHTNNTRNNQSMELVLINGTWHLVDVRICYQNLLTTHKHYNDSHINK